MTKATRRQLKFGILWVGMIIFSTVAVYVEYPLIGVIGMLGSTPLAIKMYPEY